MPAAPQPGQKHGDTVPDQSEKPTPVPPVAIIIPILNEAATLPATLASIADQDYPRDRLEVLIVDGGSRDSWRAVIEPFVRKGLKIRILENPRRTTGAAVNVALNSTTAAKVLWISGHCLLARDYVRTLAEPHGTWEGIVTGGRVSVECRGMAGILNTLLLTSRFGTGVSKWRFPGPPGWAEIVNFALFDRQQLIDLGGVDERLRRNQDNDLFIRIRKAGIRCRLVESHAVYLAPETFSGQLRRGWGNGAWAIWSSRLGKGTGDWYHFMPMVMVLTAMALLAAGVFWTPAWLVLSALAALYLLLAFGAAVIASIPVRKFWAIPILPFWIITYHVTYGIGTLSALVRPVPETPGVET